MNIKKNKAIFLDRDGVLNHTYIKEGHPLPPHDISQFKLLPGVEDAIMVLRKLDYYLIVITNQPDVERGNQLLSNIKNIHEKLQTILKLDDIFIAFDEYSDDYKPHIGLLEKASHKYSLDLSKCYMIGDRWRDIDCGNNANCFTIFIDHKYRENLNSQPHYVCSSLLEAAYFIYNRHYNKISFL